MTPPLVKVTKLVPKTTTVVAFPSPNWCGIRQQLSHSHPQIGAESAHRYRNGLPSTEPGCGAIAASVRRDRELEH